MKNRRLLKKVVSIILIAVLLITALPVQPAYADRVFEPLNEIDTRTLISLANEYAKIGALDRMIQVGGLSPDEVIKANLILTSLRSNIASMDVGPEDVALGVSALAMVGVSVVVEDWTAYWSNIISRADFTTTYRHINDSLSAWSNGLSEINNWLDSLDSVLGLPANVTDYAPWQRGFVEVNNIGWQSIFDWASGLFGTSSGSFVMPALDWQSTMSLQGLTPYLVTDNHVSYVLPYGTSLIDRNGQRAASWRDDKLKGHIFMRILYNSDLSHPEPYFGDLTASDTSTGQQRYVVLTLSIKTDGIPFSDDAFNPNCLARISHARTNATHTSFGYSSCIDTDLSLFGFPSTHYSCVPPRINEIITIEDGTTAMEFPTIDDSGKSAEQTFYEYLEALRGVDVWPTQAPPQSVCPTDLQGLFEHILQNISSDSYYDALADVLIDLMVLTGSIDLSVSDISRIINVLQPVDTWVHTGEKVGVLPHIEAISHEITIIEDIIINPPVEPPGDGEINWGRLTAAWTGLANVFPFCIPFDMADFFRSFQREPLRLPPITVNIAPFIAGGAGEITLNLIDEKYDGVVKIVRVSLFLLFALGLMQTTGRYIKW